MSETTAACHSTRALASFLAGLRYEHLSDEVVERTKDTLGRARGYRDDGWRALYLASRRAEGRSRKHTQPRGDREESPATGRFPEWGLSRGDEQDHRPGLGPG